MSLKSKRSLSLSLSLFCIVIHPTHPLCQLFLAVRSFHDRLHPLSSIPNYAQLPVADGGGGGQGIRGELWNMIGHETLCVCRSVSGNAWCRWWGGSVFTRGSVFRFRLVAIFGGEDRLLEYIYIYIWSWYGNCGNSLVTPSSRRLPPETLIE